MGEKYKYKYKINNIKYCDMYHRRSATSPPIKFNVLAARLLLCTFYLTTTSL